MGGHAHDRSRGQLQRVRASRRRSAIRVTSIRSTGALTPVAADFFNVPGGYKIGRPNSAAVLTTLFPHYGFDGTYRQYFVDGCGQHDDRCNCRPARCSSRSAPKRVTSRWC